MQSISFKRSDAAIFPGFEQQLSEAEEFFVISIQDAQ